MVLMWILKGVIIILFLGFDVLGLQGFNVGYEWSFVGGISDCYHLSLPHDHCIFNSRLELTQSFRYKFIRF